VAGTGVIDQFLETFTRYIDSGFGLLGSEVGYVATTLAAIDITLAALFWSWGTDEDIIARLVKKTLFVGVFAYLIAIGTASPELSSKALPGLASKLPPPAYHRRIFSGPGGLRKSGSMRGGRSWTLSLG